MYCSYSFDWSGFVHSSVAKKSYGKTNKKIMVMIVSEEFNNGFWCALEEFFSQGATGGQIESVIRAAGFSYEECNELIENSGLENERLKKIVNRIFN